MIGTRRSIDDRTEGCEIKLKQAMRLHLALMGRRFHTLAVDQARLHRAIGKQMQKVDELDYRFARGGGPSNRCAAAGCRFGDDSTGEIGRPAKISASKAKTRNIRRVAGPGIAIAVE